MCEELLDSLQGEHDWENDENESIKKLTTGYEDSSFVSTHSKRTYQSVNPYIKKILFTYGFSLLAFEGFIVASFILEYNYMMSLSLFSRLFKDTTLTGITFFDIINSFKNRIINDSHIQTYKGIESVKYTDLAIMTSLDLSVNSYMTNQIDTSLFTDDNLKRIQFILRGNLCSNSSLYMFLDGQNDCEAFEDGIAKSGIQLLFAKVTLELRNVYRSIIIATDKRDSDPTYDFSSILTNDESLKRISLIIRKLFSQSQLMLVNNLIDGVQQKCQSIQSIKLALFAGLYVFLGVFMVYSIIFGIMKSNKDYHNSLKMLSLLPIKAAISTPSIRTYMLSKIK